VAVTVDDLWCHVLHCADEAVGPAVSRGVGRHKIRPCREDAVAAAAQWHGAAGPQLVMRL
jgi:hypothetical protein